MLSFGINCRQQKAKETAIKQIQSALRQAKRQFPYSEIWIPLINYSTRLPIEEKQNLQIINAHIFKNMPYIALLDASEFKTQSDEIHWTPTTGVAMLRHWAKVLNLKAP